MTAVIQLMTEVILVMTAIINLLFFGIKNHIKILPDGKSQNTKFIRKLLNEKVEFTVLFRLYCQMGK